MHQCSSLWEPPNCITVCLCVCAAFGVSLWSNEGDNGVKQPSLNYNCCLIGRGLECRFGWEAPYTSLWIEQPACLIKGTSNYSEISWQWLNIFFESLFSFSTCFSTVYLRYLLKISPSGIRGVFPTLILFFLPFPQWFSYTNLNWHAALH